MKNKILIVDDEADIIDFMTVFLEDNNFEVRSADNGVKAMELVKESTPDLILLDLQMPEETGTGFYRKLHNHKKYKDIPIIVVSGLAGRKLAVSKSVVVIDKPVDKQKLLEEIQKILG